jgi:hypothetical protein
MKDTSFLNRHATVACSKSDDITHEKYTETRAHVCKTSHAICPITLSIRIWE